ncbi:MAG: glutathione peroxidase [Beijerinckiaceae bacterium]|jgi:glutathione peroxidase
MSSIYDFSLTRLDGTEEPLSDYKNSVLLIVNTASKCGFTPQYEGLEKLQRTYAGRGFSVLGFPCNQFGGQEPGNAEEIANFCKLTYDVGFPLFAKIEVNGEGAHPLYKFLKAAKPGLMGIEAIKWNFTKFLIDRHGQVVERYAPTTAPAALAGAIEALL